MTPITLHALREHLDGLLDPQRMDDYGPNGLQVAAAERDSPVHRVVVGVTSNLELIEAAAALGADALIVHHGLYWHGAPVTITGALGRRVRRLLTAGISLLAYHLPLDGHPELGNAVSLARALGAVELAPGFPYKGAPTGCTGRFAEPLSPAALEARLHALVSERTLFFPFGPEAISTLGIVTGGAPRSVREAIDRGLDLFITGEVGEYSRATAQEEHIHFAAAGHHRTERFGPAALAERLAADLPGLDVRFVDVDNPA